MNLAEQITKAQQTSAMLADDLEQAMCAADVRRPEGPSIGDKATVAYLAECLTLAQTLQHKLYAL